MKYLTQTDNQIDHSKCSELVNQICKGIQDFTDKVVVGISGGADSTLVATLSTIALGRNNVIAVSMPYSSTDIKTFNHRSQLLAKALGVKHHLMQINHIVDEIGDAAEGSFALSQLTQGNTRSRVRMLLLYATCAEYSAFMRGSRVRVMGTGNLSEDFIGYDTKFGDSAADIFPIGQLYKQEVYDLLDHLASTGIISDDLIDRTPSAGLWEGQTDEGELGHTYNEMAPAIEWLRGVYLTEGLGELQRHLLLEGIKRSQPEMYETIAFVLDRHLTNKHKHQAPPVLPLR